MLGNVAVEEYCRLLTTRPSFKSSVKCLLPAKDSTTATDFFELKHPHAYSVPFNEIISN